MSFFNELKRRNVIRVGLAYIVVVWLVTQVLEVLFDSFGSPDWVMKTVLVLMAAGLPFVLIFAWAFEMTPEGLKREKEIDRAQSITSHTGRKLDYVIIGVLVVALGYFAYDKFILDISRDAALVETFKQQETALDKDQVSGSAEVEKSIAVIPFVNMSGDQENEYFSDGLTEELLNSLARVKELKVTGRTSSFAFKGQNIDLREIGAALNVAHILEGSVRKAQNRVRITAQLINVADGYHLWSDTFDRELDDIFAIQEEIAGKVVGELTSTLLGEDTEPLVNLGTNNTQAYELYLRGRYMFDRNPDDPVIALEAEQFYQHALELDPRFTLARFGQFLVASYRQRGGEIDFQEGATQLRQLSEKMIAMDPNLAESHIAYARSTLVDRRWSASEAANRQALVLNPGSIEALDSLSGLLVITKQAEEGLVYAMEAVERDPLNLTALRSAVIALSSLGRCEESEEIAKRALSISSSASRFRSNVGFCLASFRNDYARAIEWHEKETLNFMRGTGLAIAYNKLGQQEKAQHYLDELRKSDGDAASYQYGEIYAQWGEAEKALDALEHALEIGDAGFILLNVDKRLEPLHQEPRYKALLEIWKNPSVQ